VKSNCGTCWGPYEPGVITKGESKTNDHRTEPVWHGNGNADGTSDDWVEIDLDGYYQVQKVVFYNRNDWGPERAEGARVILLNKDRQEIRSATLNKDMVQTLFDER